MSFVMQCQMCAAGAIVLMYAYKQNRAEYYEFHGRRSGEEVLYISAILKGTGEQKELYQNWEGGVSKIYQPKKRQPKGKE